MLITLYSDPHLGLKRQSHTTPASSLRWKQRILETVSFILAEEKPPLLCLGDVFDSYSNSEEDIYAGYGIALGTDIILAGNHDIVNRADKTGSLQLLRQLFAQRQVSHKIVLPGYGSHAVYSWGYGQAQFVFVPHVAQKDLFEQALQEAEGVAGSSGCPYLVLCLHCNYDLSEGLTGADTTLNLTQERAYKLLESFHRILIGHEHVARQDHQTDRIQLLGSVFPTSFSDLSDKFYWRYDAQTNLLTKHLCWSAESGYYKGPASLAPPGKEFYDLQDDLNSRECAKLVTSLYDLETTLAVRLNREERSVTSETAASVGEFQNLPKLIQAELGKASPDLLPLFNTYLTQAAQN